MTSYLTIFDFMNENITSNVYLYMTCLRTYLQRALWRFESAMPPFNETRGFFLTPPSDTHCGVSTSAHSFRYISFLCYDPSASVIETKVLCETLRCCCLSGKPAGVHLWCCWKATAAACLEPISAQVHRSSTDLGTKTMAANEGEGLGDWWQEV